jgi:hypothetical protein
MNQPTFRGSYFALLESYAPQLLAGPEARVSQAKTSALDSLLNGKQKSKPS